FYLAIAAVAFFAALTSAGYVVLASSLTLLGALGSWLGARWSIKPFAQAVDLLMALTATGLGVRRSIRGERVQTGTAASTIRSTMGGNGPVLGSAARLPLSRRARPCCSPRTTRKRVQRIARRWASTRAPVAMA